MNKTLKIMLILISTVFIVMAYNGISNAANNKANIKTEYIYNEKTNTVLMKVVSDKRMKNTKKNWKLSSDGLVYSYEFNNNTKYFTTFEDIYGNKITVPIEVTKIIKRKLELNVTYGQYNEKTNTVTVMVKANNQLADTKKNWQLSQDKLMYTYTFKNNTNYNTTFKDVQGNNATANIKISQIDDKGPVLNIKYEHIEGINNVKVIVTSNEKLKDTKKNWTLSQDKMSYTYNFRDNTNYTTEFKDIWGNPSKINIKVTQIDKISPKIAIKYTHNDDNTVRVDLISNEKLKETKKNWQLIGEGRIYTYTFKDDIEYTTTVQDLCGNTTKVALKAKKKMYSYPGTPNIKTKYLYTNYETVKVEVISDVKFQHTKQSWKLSSDGYRYTNEFKEYSVYTTPFKDINGHTRNINIIVDQIRKKIKCEQGTYGISGLKNIGAGGSNLKYYKIGSGPNVFFATFSIHGFEDLYNNDGKALTKIAEDFKNKLIELQDMNLDAKWTIYIFPCLNPDGQINGYSHNGPGRTTMTSLAPGGKGIDLNRCWHISGTTYTRYTTSRNYNGTAGFQATEARALRDFLIAHKSRNGKTVLVDLHGWLNETLGDNQIASYYRSQYGISYHNPNYGTGYLINWARATLGARSSLVELPEYDSNSTKYINATLNMLRGI